MPVYYIGGITMSIMTPAEWDALYLRVFGDLERNLIEQRREKQSHWQRDNAKRNQYMKDRKIKLGGWGTVQRPHYTHTVHSNPADLAFSTLIKFWKDGESTYNWIFPINTYHYDRDDS
jgi:hypothetical protein